MKLRSKFLKWNAGLPVAMLNKETAIELGVKAQEMILIKTLSKHPKEMTAVLDIIDGEFGKKQILLSLEVKSKMNLKKGQIVDINIAPIPRSVDLIRKKLNNKRLSRKEIDEIIKDIVNDRLSEPEIALFVAAMYRSGMTNKETIYLINAILKTGERFSVKDKFVVDKHSIGGVAGNRTTPIVVPICAAAGLKFPKTSSRAITSAAGTADVMETIVKVGFPIPELKKILKKTNAFIVWGGGMGTVPADSKIIKVERELKIDPKSQLLASIMSKKFAVGSKYILIDIPYGKTAKMPTRKKAKSLARKFLQLGRYFHKKMKVVLTDGSQPVGNGIGPALELMDIIKILDPKKKGPEDLEKKSLFLAGNLFEMTGKAKKGKGIEMAEKILYSGKAFEKFKEIVKAQEGNLNRIKYAKLKKDILSDKIGKVTEIDNKKINNLARVAGSPADKSAGIYLYHHVGDAIKKGEKIVTIYSETSSRIDEAFRFYKENKPITIK
ncbi:MAG TPA: thymidine phosphorylase [Candidatus Nanoarchaeia archaeon]|nr:thymidine phosphorylase [Candidatus Nanoarchaeia archaeon]